MNKKDIQNRGNTNKKKLSLQSHSNKDFLVKTELFGVGITNEMQENILEFIVKSIEKKEKPYYVVTPNPEMIVLSVKNPLFKKVLNNAKIASNDGIGLGIASKILGKSLGPRTTGVELLENLCKRIANRPITVSFLGGRPGIAEKASECLKQKYPGLKVVFAVHEMSFQEKIPPTDILFVAFGAPRQEFWMSDHLGKIPARVMIGVGGALDYLSGTVPRAPKILRAFGFEWLFRLVVQPWRWRRQIALPIFLFMILQDKLKKLR